MVARLLFFLLDLDWSACNLGVFSIAVNRTLWEESLTRLESLAIAMFSVDI